MKLFFEPWNLGDAVIAASVASVAPEETILACNSRWHEVLGLISNHTLKLLPLDLPYVWRSSGGRFNLGAPPSLSGALPTDLSRLEVISIRGDVRDWISARRIFSGARFHFTGWVPYLARWVPVVDLPFRYRLLGIRNRYRAWAAASGTPYAAVEERPRAHRPPQAGPVLIHVGAQWRSKQYPHVAELRERLVRTGHRVEILAGPADPLPPGIAPEEVERPSWAELVRRLREARMAITNDSGPMHLAAYLGCPTLALSRCSNIAEWLPPGVTPLSSPLAPIGYTPLRGYWTDGILEGWTSPDEVAARVTDGGKR